MQWYQVIVAAAAAIISIAVVTANQNAAIAARCACKEMVQWQQVYNRTPLILEDGMMKWAAVFGDHCRRRRRHYKHRRRCCQSERRHHCSVRLLGEHAVATGM